MYHKKRNLLACLVLASLTASACVTRPQAPREPSLERTFKAKYEETWRALQQSIMQYPLRMNNMDTGQIQTILIKSSNNSSFQTPGQKKSSSGYRYRLLFNVSKVNEDRTKVSISKKAELARDFFSDPEEQQSNGLEESVLLYRIGREIIIERALIKATKTKR